jgi:hypothetical protein
MSPPSWSNSDQVVGFCFQLNKYQNEMFTTTEEWIKLIAAIGSFTCVLSGIIAVFRGIQAEGEIDLSGVISGRIKTGSAGVLLIFFGVIVFSVLIGKGVTRSVKYSAKKSGEQIEMTETRGHFVDELNAINTLYDAHDISCSVAYDRLFKLCQENSEK